MKKAYGSKNSVHANRSTMKKTYGSKNSSKKRTEGFVEAAKNKQNQPKMTKTTFILKNCVLRAVWVAAE